MYCQMAYIEYKPFKIIENKMVYKKHNETHSFMFKKSVHIEHFFNYFIVCNFLNSNIELFSPEYS